MKLPTAAALAILLLSAPAALAGAVDDANAGLDALDHGDNATAVRLFSQALREGGLSDSDRELAFVKRAQAYLGEGQNDLARQDLEQALRIDANDQEAAALMRRAEAQPPTQGQPSAAATTKPQKLVQAQNWIAVVYRNHGQTICYAFTKVRDSIPPLAHRGPASLFVEESPAQRDVVQIDAGFNYSANASASLDVDATHLEFGTNRFYRPETAYARDGAAAVAAFRQGSLAVAHSQTDDGHAVTDSFSLAGFAAAYAAIVKACPASADNRGSRSWLGLMAYDLTEPVAQRLHLSAARGALVVGVMPGGVAEQAGIKPGDVIQTYDGETVTGFHDFAADVARTQIGQAVKLGVWRDGQELTLEPTTAAWP